MDETGPWRVKRLRNLFEDASRVLLSRTARGMFPGRTTVAFVTAEEGRPLIRRVHAGLSLRE